MIRSMTGFGRGEAQVGGLTVVAEARSVNHRFLDVALRLPREHAPFDSEVQARVRAACRRGRVELTIKRQVSGSETSVVSDPDLFAAYVAAVEPMLAGRSDAERAAVLPVLLAQPGVLTTSGRELPAAIESEALLAAVEGALVAMVAMRSAEGVALAADVRGLLDALASDAAEVSVHTADLSARLLARLQERLTRLVGEGVDPWRVAQEAAVLADRSDVAEELSRLQSHLDQAREALVSEDAVGRKLDFLVQELLREVNTLGSKTVDAPVSHRVVSMKTTIERLREQAANVE